jgi:hypothetical protein
MSSEAGLYGIRKPKNTPKETSSSTSLAFTSTLSSLISNAPTSQQRGRPRTSKTKEDIFSVHNKNTKKRAARDLEQDGEDSHGQVHKNDIGAVDDALLHRSKRKMAEKAKKYRAMKRGEYVPAEGESESLIDFDQKWADKQREGKRDSLSSSESESDDEGRGETVEYEDEYGRHRIGTLADAERMERKKLNRALGQEELDRISARPSMPSQLIYGDTVQTAAFNPDEPIATKMEEIAAKRDRSLTPPEQKHYEADKEFRIKGVGFYSFSKDEGVREAEMRELERERGETERVRKERTERMEKRKREVEERRREIGERRAKKLADSFLDGLTATMEKPDG